MGKSKKAWTSLRQIADFNALRNEGRYFQAAPWLVVCHRSQSHELLRCGWTLPKAVGNAVVRNRLKRWSREFVRHYSRDKRLSVDANFIFRKKGKDFYRNLSHQDLDFAFDRFFRYAEKRKQH